MQEENQEHFSVLGYGYEEARETAKHLLSLTDVRPVLGIVCGSGLGSLADQLTGIQVFSYKDIPHFPVSTAPGHAGQLIFGYLHDKPCVCMKGRVHLYEGFSTRKVVFPIHVMKLLGIDTLIITSAVGGLNRDYKVGDLVIIKDHINIPGLTGNNPLIGPNDERFGPRFPAVSQSYDVNLRSLGIEIGKQLAKEMDITVREGVLVMQTGPCFETVSESRLLLHLGADIVGMSTIPEVIAAQHCGIRVFAMSLVTNLSIMDLNSNDTATSEEVLEIGQLSSKRTQRFISQFVKEIDFSS